MITDQQITNLAFSAAREAINDLVLSPGLLWERHGNELPPIDDADFAALINNLAAELRGIMLMKPLPPAFPGQTVQYFVSTT